MVKIIGCHDNEILAVKDNIISGYKISKPLNDMGKGVLQLKLLLGLGEDQSIHFKHKDNPGIVELLDDILKEKNQTLKEPIFCTTTLTQKEDENSINKILEYLPEENYRVKERLICNLDEIYNVYLFRLENMLCRTYLAIENERVEGDTKKEMEKKLCSITEMFNKVISPLSTIPVAVVAKLNYQKHIERLREFKKEVLSNMETVIIDINILDLVFIINNALYLYESKDKYKLEIKDIQLYIYRELDSKGRFDIKVYDEYKDLLNKKARGVHSSITVENVVRERAMSPGLLDKIF